MLKLFPLPLLLVWLALAPPALVLPALALPSPSFGSLVKEKNLIGETTLSVWLFGVYHAQLYAPLKRWRKNKPFVLRISYLRDFKNSSIAKRTIKEMRKQGFKNENKLQRWQKEMLQLFPNVKEGDWIAGMRGAKGFTHFFYNKKYLGKISDKQFTQKFFDIWLGANTTEPAMRRKLFGRK